MYGIVSKSMALFLSQGLRKDHGRQVLSVVKLPCNLKPALFSKPFFSKYVSVAI